MKKRTSKRAKHDNTANLPTINDPRQALFLTAFLDPQSPTFSNALQSALKVGYSQEYSESITSQMPQWLSESLGELDMVSRAIRNLNKFLDLETKVQAMGAFGPIYEKRERMETVTGRNGKKRKKKVVEKIPILVQNGKLLEIQQKTSHFVAERLARQKFGPPKQGGPGVVVPVQVNVHDDRERYA